AGGFDDYADVGPVSATYYVALYNLTSISNCVANPYLPGYTSSFNTSTIPWIRFSSYGYITQATQNLSRGSYRFSWTITANNAIADPSFRQRAFSLDRPSGSYHGALYGVSQGVSYQGRQSTSCEMIPRKNAFALTDAKHTAVTLSYS